MDQQNQQGIPQQAPAQQIPQQQPPIQQVPIQQPSAQQVPQQQQPVQQVPQQQQVPVQQVPQQQQSSQQVPVQQVPVQQVPVQQASQQPPIQQVPLQGNTIAQPIQQGAPLQEEPKRAIILAAVLLFTIWITNVFAFGWDENTTSYIYVLFFGMLACASYLIAQPQTMYRIFGGAIAVVAPFPYVFSLINYMMTRTGVQRNIFDPTFATYIPTLIQVLILSLLVVGTAFLLSFLLKGTTKRKTLITTLVCGGVIVVASFIMGLLVSRMGFSYAFFVSFLGKMPVAIAFGLAYVLVRMLCNLKSYNLVTKVGHKIWFGICLGFTSISAIVTAIAGAMGMTYSGYVGFLLVVLTLAGVLGYVQLCMSKRMGYLVILLAIGTMFFGEIHADLLQLMMTSSSGKVAFGSYFSTLFSSLTMVVNPLITGIVLLFIWKKLPPQTIYTKRPVPTLFKVFSIIGIVLGFLLFLVGSSEFFTTFSARSMATPPAASFLLGVFFGAATLTLGIYATLASFRKQSKAPMGLFITNIVTVGLSVVFLLLIVII